MRRRRLIFGAAALAAFAGTAGTGAAQGRGRGPGGPGLTLSTPALQDGAEIPPRFTQSAETPVSPKLDWTHVPSGTVSFAIIMHPDVARQRSAEDMLHWYRGPGAPAAGPHHHYTWEFYALDTKLDLGPDATRAQLLEAMNGHIVGKAVLVGRIHR
jgi:phosphatidylethanolamine-binding protein (PEBP) family uncharacterized protein